MKQLVVGIDIGGTNSVFGLVDREGNMYGEGVVPTRKYPDFDQYLEELYIGINNLLKTVDIEYELVGIGIGAPCANHYKGTIDNAADLVWKGVLPFTEKMKRYFPNLPVILTNDANAAAIGEMIYGGAKGMKDFIVVTLGTGVGSGFVANGQLVYGHDSFAGELGHVIVNHTGRMCGCGRKGCLETYASATGIKRTAFKLLADHIEDSEFRNISYNDLTAEMITKAALNGDPLAIEAYEYTGMVLGRALADAVAITSPEAIFLFGGLAKAGKYIFEPTKKYMEMYMLSNFRNKVKLLPSAIDGKNAAVLGASALVWQEKDGEN
ncbi:MAG TPA: ROK family protein [Candidatus Avirikenella pullistercoris]|nr:ROK family protein [Candidatus Avirikenella pullistercoris]